MNEVLCSVGRTEDVRFSPDSRRLAIAAFIRNQVAVLDVEISAAGTKRRIEITGGVELSSDALKEPHGLDFLDRDTLIVASRIGTVTTFRLPAGSPDIPMRRVVPLASWRGPEARVLQLPSCVRVVPDHGAPRELLICNLWGTITRHQFDPAAGGALRKSDVVLRKWLDTPDGVNITGDRRWIAFSNHESHSVFTYDCVPEMNEDTEPVGILRGVRYPHGLCFSADGRRLYVAEAGAPMVQVYAAGDDGWRGVRDPIASFRIADDSAILSQPHDAENSGPKGLDIDGRSGVLAVTCQFQPLAFFDTDALELPVASATDFESAVDVGSELERMKEMHLLRKRARDAEARVDYLTHSMSWRITAPLRALHGILRRS